jgi:uncharacterized repeat protein (TIGR01451 family)
VAGTTITLEVTVSNAGPMPARDAVASVGLPEGFTLRPTIGSRCSAARSMVVCDAWTLPVDASRSMTFRAAIDPALVYQNGGPIDAVNSAATSHAGGDPDAGDDQDP